MYGSTIKHVAGLEHHRAFDVDAEVGAGERRDDTAEAHAVRDVEPERPRWFGRSPSGERRGAEVGRGRAGSDRGGDAVGDFGPAPASDCSARVGSRSTTNVQPKSVT